MYAEFFKIMGDNILMSETDGPSYWQKACNELIQRDRILKKIIPRFASVSLISCTNPFHTLARSIVSQQISINAANTIWARLMSHFSTFDPLTIIQTDHASLKSCGLPMRKIEYLIDLAKYFYDRSSIVPDLSNMSDERIIKELMKIRGIGRWTAEMFLIFNLTRPNILPLDDIGLLKAISLNYFSGEPVTRSEAREVAANWDPWCTVATWYLWRSLNSTTNQLGQKKKLYSKNIS